MILIQTQTPILMRKTLSFNTTTNILTIAGGNTVDLSSLKDNSDSQTLSVTGSGLTRQLVISGGNTVALADSDNQSLSLSSNTLSLADGGSVDLSPYLDNTDNQALSWNNATRTLSLANGGSVVIPDADTTYSAGTGITISSGVIGADLGTEITSGEIVDGTITSDDLANTGASAEPLAIVV